MLSSTALAARLDSRLTPPVAVTDDEPPPAASAPQITVLRAYPQLPEDMRCWLQSRCQPRFAAPRPTHGGN